MDLLPVDEGEIYQDPEAPPPPEDPPPPENPPEELLPPELHELPELPEENDKPPMEAFPLVRRSSLAFLYHGVLLIYSFTSGYPMRYTKNTTRVALAPSTIIGKVAQKGIKNR